jgi:hypothetical protein
MPTPRVPPAAGKTAVAVVAALAIWWTVDQRAKKARLRTQEEPRVRLPPKMVEQKVVPLEKARWKSLSQAERGRECLDRLQVLYDSRAQWGQVTMEAVQQYGLAGYHERLNRCIAHYVAGGIR